VSIRQSKVLDGAWTDFVDQFYASPLGELGTVRCSQLHVRGTAVVIGDAAHATVPFAGQGMNAALETAAALADHLVQHRFFDASADATQRERVLRSFSAVRKRDADAMIELSLSNYRVLCELQASRIYRWRVLYQQAMAKLLPSYYPSTLYSLLNFTNLSVWQR
jgi:2-polyprenyl-6-methoxyphenol hydroxylase-like FAD-dependent oxidoreductase